MRFEKSQWLKDAARRILLPTKTIIHDIFSARSEELKEVDSSGIEELLGAGEKRKRQIRAEEQVLKFLELVQTRMKRKGISRKQLAEKLEWGEYYTDELLSGESRVNAGQIFELAEILDIKIKYLYEVDVKGMSLKQAKKYIEEQK